MKCPECSHETRSFDESYDVIWCPHCRKAFSFEPGEDGTRIPFFTLPAKTGTIDPENKVLFEYEEEREAMSVTTFSYSSIVMTLVTLVWLLFTVYALFLDPWLAALFFVIAFILVMCTIAQWHSKITLAYIPAAKEIVYTKGPFKWWRSKVTFKATEIESVQEGSVDSGLKEVPRPAIFFNTKRHCKLLDFSVNVTKCLYLWTWLEVCIVRGTK